MYSEYYVGSSGLKFQTTLDLLVFRDQTVAELRSGGAYGLYVIGLNDL